MTMPSPPEKPNGELTTNEAQLVMTSCLKSKHLNDPIIICFINNFLRCKSIKQACEETGVKYALGYSIRHRKDVANCITKLIGLSAVKYGYDATEVFERAKEIAEFDPIDVMNADGTYKSNMYDIAPEARRCIKKLKVKNLWAKETDINGVESKLIIGEVIEFEFHDKMKGIELAGKEKEMFKNTTKVEHSVTKDMANILLASAKRAEDQVKTITQADVIDVIFAESE